MSTFPTIVCANTCDCNAILTNTKTGCITTKAVEKKTWIVNEIGSDGTKNFIDLTQTLDDTYLSGLMNEANPLDRFYPLPEIKNVSDNRDKTVTYTWKDGTEVFVRDGVRKFEGMFPPEVASPQLLGILEGQRCAKPCKFAIDANGTIWGRVSADGTKLYPVKMDAQSVAPIFINPNDTEPTMIAYSFNLHPTEKDCKLRGIPASELTGDINPLDYEGLFDVIMKVNSCTTSLLNFTLYNRFGTILNPETVKYLLTGDFTLVNVTDSGSAIAWTGSGGAFAEVTPGTYRITFNTADQPTSADVLKLTPSKTDYDFALVVATQIVVS